MFVSVPGLEFLEPAQVIDTNTLHSSPQQRWVYDGREDNRVRARRSVKRDVKCGQGFYFAEKRNICLGKYFLENMFYLFKSY